MPPRATVPTSFKASALVVPEWNKSHVTVVDPAIWSVYRSRQCDLRPVYHELLNAFRSLGVSYTVLTKEDYPIDIWLRDWGSTAGCYFDFNPSYAKGWYSQRAIAKARRNLDRRHGVTPRSIPLVLDGGNVVHNGKVAIVTEKVLLDNRHLSKREIERAIISGLGCEAVVMIPVEPGDKIGHSDGILRFVNSDILLINDYRDPGFRRYSTELLKRLRSNLPCVRIVPFPWFSEPLQTNGIWSARGVYVNFFLSRGGISYPVFDHRLDDSVASLLSELSKLPIRAVSASALARLGGGIHCITM